MRFRATSYSMGRALGSVEFEASTPRAAVDHQRLRGLPAGAQPGIASRVGKVRVIGIKRLG